MCNTGLLSLFEIFSNRNLTILALHRVVTDEVWAQSLYKPMMVTVGQFESMLQMIRKYYHPLTLSEAVRKIKAGESFERDTVVITFDDGYLDVYQHAYPLLLKYNIPATLFLTTGVIGDEVRYLWWDEIDYYCHVGGRNLPDLDDSFPEEFKTVTRLMKQLPNHRTSEIEREIRAILLGASIDQRNRFIEKLGASVSGEDKRLPLMLSWDNVREMSDLVEMSNHTMNHRLLDELDAAEVEYEITASKKCIEEVTGKPCQGLAYPGGAYTPEVVEIAKQHGIEHAVTTYFSNNSHNTNLLALDRKDVGYLYIDNKVNSAYFRVVVSGVMDWSRWISPDNPSWASRPDIGGKAVQARPTPLIVHVIYHLAVGGLENGLVNLINRIPEDRYRHAIICMTDYTDFRNRIQNPNVGVYVLNKRPGKDLKIYVTLWKLLRRLKPDIVHTRNLATLEAQFPALMAGVPRRVHGEHGRDIHDLDGTSKKYQLLRRLFKPMVQQYIALSYNLQDYLRDNIGVPGKKLTHICNGVDTEKFRPADTGSRDVLPAGFAVPGTLVFGTVGRMEAVKDQVTLARAFVQLVEAHSRGRDSLRLVMVGGGALREPAMTILRTAGLEELAWLPGERNDVPELLRALDVFVLPSLAEGISNTILEAMASGLPVVATEVGGNGELVDPETTGFLVKRGDPAALAGAMQQYIDIEELQQQHGTMARKRCEEKFSINTMVQRYQDLYDSLMQA